PLGGLLFLTDVGARDRGRMWALALGGGLAAAYYLQFLGLMLDQVPRALGGGGAGGTGAIAGLAAEMGHAASEWGWPLLGLAACGWASRGVSFHWGPNGPRALAVLGLAGLPFLAAAAASPLAVRYLYAVAPAVALLAADGLLAAMAPGPGALLRRALGLAALLAQTVLFLAGVAWTLFERYRA
ncbi:MAG TPA: hypothetical protein VIZ31_06340, partial [Vicinamibacteria bacterium]